MGVQTTCMSGGETSCATAAALDASEGSNTRAFTSASRSAAGTKNAPPTVRQSRAAKRA